jgi:hypothetical protein
MKFFSIKSKALLLAPCALLFAMVGCHPSTDQIATTVKGSMQSTFDTNPNFAPAHFQVGKVNVVKADDGTYTGTAGITFQGTEHQVPFHITMNGTNVDWKIDPGGLLFAQPATPATDAAPAPAP